MTRLAVEQKRSDASEPEDRSCHTVMGARAVRCILLGKGAGKAAV